MVGSSSTTSSRPLPRIMMFSRVALEATQDGARLCAGVKVPSTPLTSFCGSDSRQTGLRDVARCWNQGRMTHDDDEGLFGLEGRRLLVVEDNTDCAEAVRRWLEICGAQVTTA